MFQVSEIPTVRGLDESATYHQLAFLYMGRKSKKIPGESHARRPTLDQLLEKVLPKGEGEVRLQPDTAHGSLLTEACSLA
jgi:hypothetical protein